MMQFMRMLAAMLLAVLVTACGGGGGSPGDNPGTTPGQAASSAVADFSLFTNKTSIANSGNEGAAVTVVAVDKNRNVVSGAEVAVTTDQNSFFAPSAESTTDDLGIFSGVVGIGSDKSDRDITISVTINGITKNTSVRVAGSKLTLEAVPSTPAPGQTVTLTATLRDSSGNAISAAPIKLGGTIPALQGQTVTSSTSGVVTKTFTAPAVAGIYTISATGSGVSAAEYQLQVFSTSVPAALIPAGVAPSLAASPNVLAVNAPGASANKSTLRFLFLNAANSPIPNVRVRFDDITTGLAAVGATISSGSSVLYTDASGSVTAQYVAGQNSSPTNGVTVRACYSATDFASATACPASVQATLTVAGQALAISIGDDNLLEPGTGTYIKRFAVTVADSAGRAVASAPVDISVDLTHFGKGSFGLPYLSGDMLIDPLAAVPSSLTAAYPSISTIPSAATGRVWCANEDTNRNGNVDPGDNLNGSVDSNGQPTLEPRKSDLIVSYADPLVTTTNASGILEIKVEYSQRFATWLAYRVRVTANVAGSQGMAERLFVTNYIEGDDEDGGSFLQPPYGFSSCDTAN